MTYKYPRQDVVRIYYGMNEDAPETTIAEFDVADTSAADPNFARLLI